MTIFLINFHSILDNVAEVHRQFLIRNKHTHVKAEALTEVENKKIRNVNIGLQCKLFACYMFYEVAL